MIDHVAFEVDNINEAVEWYTTTVEGAEVVYQDESWAMLDILGSKLALILPGTHPPHFAILCNSTKLFPCKENEVNEHRDGSKYFYLRDPYGNAVEWIHYPEDDIFNTDN